MISITCKAISYWSRLFNTSPSKSTHRIHDNWARQFSQCRNTINRKIYNAHSDQLPSSGYSQFSFRMCIWRFSLLTFLWFWIGRIRAGLYVYVKHHVLRISIVRMVAERRRESVVCRMRNETLNHNAFNEGVSHVRFLFIHVVRGISFRYVHKQTTPH